MRRAWLAAAFAAACSGRAPREEPAGMDPRERAYSTAPVGGADASAEPALGPPACVRGFASAHDHFVNGCTDAPFEVFDNRARLPFYDGHPVTRDDVPAPSDGGV